MRFSLLAILCIAASGVTLFVLEMFVVGRLSVFAYLGILPFQKGAKYYSCDRCGAIKVILFNNKKPLAEKRVYVDEEDRACNHKWKRGLCLALRKPLKNGEVVLLKTSGEFGAFVARAQQFDPPKINYEWYLGPDEAGSFCSEGVTSGTGTGPPVLFGPFTVSWSGQAAGSGYLYYQLSPEDTPTSADTFIARSGFTTIKDANVYDATLAWKAKPF